MRMRVICRGSSELGLGHLIRARSFARAALSAGHEVELAAIVAPELEELLADAPCATCCVPDDAALLRTGGGRPWDVVVYDLTVLERCAFEATAASGLVTASLSPVFEHMAEVDACFTRGLAVRAAAGVRLYAGLEYAVFSERCVPIDDAAYSAALALPELSVAVCMGGGDAANKTLTVLSALASLDAPCTIWVLLGEGYAHCYNALVGATRGRMRHEVILAKTNRSMWRVMGNCAVAVLAGGLTTIEAVYAGLPSVNLFERTEHREMVSELASRGVCVDGGLFSDESLERTLSALRTFAADRAALAGMRRRTRGLIDARGGQRVVRALESLIVERAVSRLRFAEPEAAHAAD